ncbi:MAG: MmgE/PrpD family protein [Pseudomonadota bacterium]
MMNSRVTERLAKLAANIRFEEIPETVVSKAKDCILDSIGTAVAGSASPASVMVWDVLSSAGDHTDESTVLGRSMKTSCIDAAFVNGTSAHSIEMDDFHRKGVVHPAVTVIPAALAAAEKQKSKGSELIVAAVMGYEAVCRIGIATGVSQYERGFHPTSTCGVFGAAVASGRLWGLDALSLANALGIAGSFAGGLREWRAEGALTKPLQVGRAAQNGVLGAILASVGYTGPTTVLEGNFGFCGAYGKRDSLEEAFDGLGDSFEIENISFKPFASCRFTHPAIEGVLRLKAEKEIEPSEIEEVLVKLSREMYRGVMWPEERKYKPETVSDAQFSLPYCIAAALIRGGVLLSEFSSDCIHDPELLELGQRIRAEVCPQCEAVFPDQTRQVVEVTMKDGQKYTYQADYAKGDPENPMTKEELHEKFIRLASPVLGESSAYNVLQIIDNLEAHEDLHRFYELLCSREV